MNLSIDLPKILEEQLVSYCHAYGITENEAVQRALHRLLNDSLSPTPYELGTEGFGADHTHSGDIAKNSQRLLRERFRASTIG
jgi:hypothetical protein